MTVDPELSLEERFCRGDEGAMREMYREFSAPMYVIALRLLGRHELAADTVQRAFVQAWRAAGSFDVSRGLQPWLYAITRRAAIDVYRGQRRAAEMLSLEPEQIDRVMVAYDPTMEETWQTWQVRQALDQLAPAEREVIDLAYHGGQTQSEIAAHLGIALGTVKSRTSRALRHLAASLGHLRDDALTDR
ncbi:sigma-70 family RNA polymerase sigma factor [Kribbella sp. NPDC023855]|uniref:RNA polymerase sigma factor n=1 Tax=Kribbella sp. NPDC023855 TaxID=3154698 RepID=UPI0034042D80